MNSGDEFLQNMAVLGELMGRTMLWNMARTLMPVSMVIIAGLAWWVMRRTS